MANPLIYGFLDERFRLEVRLLFKRLVSCNCKAIFATWVPWNSEWNNSCCSGHHFINL